MTEREKYFIKGILKKIYIFESLTEDETEEVIQGMRYYEAQETQLIFVEQSKAEYYCILRKGLLEVIKDGATINEIQEGQGFGEAALLHECKRTADVRAVKRSSF